MMRIGSGEKCQSRLTPAATWEIVSTGLEGRFTGRQDDRGYGAMKNSERRMVKQSRVMGKATAGKGKAGKWRKH